MKAILIKLGGAALVHPDSLKVLGAAVKVLKERGEKVVIVHGGGPIINRRLTEKKIPWSFHEGQRITTPEMMGVIEGALGEVNEDITSIFANMGLRPLGLSGAMGELFLCEPQNEKLGQVGKIVNVNVGIIEDALEANLTPVIAPIGVDRQGLSYNINADWGASALASALNVRTLLFATDQRGVLDIHGLPYDGLSLAQLRLLMEKGGVSGGMLAKARSIESALLKGVPKVCVLHALELLELVETNSGGTLCVELGRLETIMRKEGSNYAIAT